PTPMPVLAVGAGTAAEARARGFADVTAAQGDAAALATLAAARLDPAGGPLLLAVGRGYGADLAAALRARGFRVIRRVVYAAAPATALPEPARAAIAQGRVAAMLVTSPRGARIMATLLRRAGLADATRAMRALVLSPRIAEALAPLRFAAVAMPARPDPGLLPALLGAPPA
ncbi:uroporphyrinogen-III synthase, partial [Roseomonas sp. CECT 9278]|uniref:uroporphyrinogen-III synthase n=1 Tax=Roseomonas sp. CECT 9278 TaxID=2845823 RepID=UPI001E3B7C91